MDILFPDNWRETARAYLKPLETKWRHPDDEQPDYVGYYAWKAHDYKITPSKGAWGTFSLDAATLHYLATPGWQGEQSAVIIWSTKAQFDSPLHFWACAALLSQLNYSGEDWFKFQEQPTCKLADLTTLSAWSPESRGQWPPHWRPTPEVTREKILRGWDLDHEDDYSETLLCETGKSYFLWEWDTGA